MTLAAMLLSLNVFGYDAGPLAINVPEKTIEVPIQGKQVPLIVKGTAWPIVNADGISVVLDSVIEITSLRSLIVEAVRSGANSNDDCGNKVNLHTITVDVYGNGLSIRMSGHFERWVCGYITHPVFDGWNNTFIPTPRFRMVTERIHQNKLFEQNGTISLQLDPSSSGSTVQLVPSIRDMVADGLLGTFLQTAFVGDAIRGKIQSLISSAIDPNNLRFSLPLDSQKYSAQIQSIRFADLGGGKVGVISQVSVGMPKAVVERLISEAIH